MSKLFDDASLAMIPSAYKDGKLYSIRPTDGSGDFTFSRGSNLAATRVDVNGLIEKGRENLLLYSNDFSSGNWTTANISLTSGQLGYDGSNNAWLAQGNGLGTSRLQQNGLNWTNSVYSLSFYAKAGTESVVNIYDGTWSGVIGATYDLSTGTATQYPISIPVVEAKMVSVGNGWWRCSFTAIANAFTNTAGFVRIGIGSTTAANSGNIYIQDAQLELGLVATDYIETGASTAQAGILEDMPRLDYSGGASCPSLLLEPQRSNLVTQSEVFNIDSSWFSSGRPVAETNATTSPEGLLNASKLTFAPTHTLRNASELTFTNGYSYSIFVKKDIGRYVTIFAAFFTTTAIIGFDLDEGTCQEGGVIEPYGDGWYRISVSKSVAGDADKSGYFYLYSTDSLGSTTSVGGNQLYVYGAQIEEGSYPTSYIPTYGSSVTRNHDVCKISGVDATAIVDKPAMTLFAEINHDTANTNTNILSIIRKTTSGAYGDFIGFVILNNSQVRIEVRANNTAQADFRSAPIQSGNHKMAVVVANDNVRLFVDGVLIDTSTSATLPTGLNEIYMGGYPDTTTRYGTKKQFLFFPTALTDSECIALTTL